VLAYFNTGNKKLVHNRVKSPVLNRIAEQNRAVEIQAIFDYDFDISYICATLQPPG